MGLFDIFNTNDQQAEANSQIAGINQGLGALNQYFGQGQNALNKNYAAGLQPYLQNYQTSQAGTTALGNALGLNGPSGNAAAVQAFQNNPGYQFQLQQGDNAINAQAAATGSLNSGTTLKALSDYNQGFAGTSWNNYIQNLQPYLNYSQGSAGGIGGLYSGLGNQLNANLMGQGNANYGGLTSIGNANANANLAGLNASANTLNAGMNLAGGLFGFFSDERTKEDVRPVGELADGQQIYRFRYRGDPYVRIGLMAQEVERSAPDAVFDSGVGDLKAVDYGRATDRAAKLLEFTPRERKASPGIDYAGDLMRIAA